MMHPLRTRLGLMFQAVLVFGVIPVEIRAMDATDPVLKLAATRAYRSPKDTVEILPKEVMGRGGDMELCATVFRPKNPPTDPLPAIVYIHGGGWDSGQHYNNFAAWFAERGYFVVSIQYRLSKEAPWPAQIEDCKLGIRWLRANAEKYHINPDRIGVWGTSAGAHLASCVGVMTDPALEGTGGYPGVSSRVQAVAAFSPPTDFVGDWKLLPRFLPLGGGATQEENPVIWKQASPLHHVQAGAPPFFIAHGENDSAVPFSQGERFARALEQAGNTVEFLVVPDQGHSFWLDPTTPESTMKPTHEEIFAQLINFFDRSLKKAPPQ